MSIEKRFWEKVKKLGEDDCWEWQGNRLKTGYGKFKVVVERGKYKQEMAHRISFRLSKGPIPSGLIVCHTCDNPPCVNPNHLWVGTHADNSRDRDAKGRGRFFGEKHGMSKLTPSDVLEIRKLYVESRERYPTLRGRKNGLSQREIGEMFGVSQTQISRIIHNKRWRSV